MKVRIGFSTCPNDTFIFDALVNGKVDVPGLEFVPYLADVEELNQLALRAELDVTKLSYHAFGHVTDRYKLMDSGSALGRGNGPLLVSKNLIDKNQVSELRIAIPGELTTANLLMGIAFPKARNKHHVIFSEIEREVLNGESDLGVLIHETRFTYADHGLILVQDLGKFWEDKTGLPIPLGGIVVRRDWSRDLQMKIQNGIRKSLEFAIANPESSWEYMTTHAQEMDQNILNKHVQTFVNDFSVSLGEEGRKAVESVLDLGNESGLFKKAPKDFFV
jgi:1,4-dihydroxy-6-naphthoate synthase